MKYKLFLLFLWIFPCFETMAQINQENNNDSLYYFIVYYCPDCGRKEPRLYGMFMPLNDSCVLDVSNRENIEKSINPYKTFNLGFYSPWMEYLCFRDSSTHFINSTHANNYSKWQEYGERINDFCYRDTNENSLTFITASIVTGVAKRNVDRYAYIVGILNQVIPLVVDEKCVREHNKIVLSKQYLHVDEKLYKSD